VDEVVSALPPLRWTHPIDGRRFVVSVENPVVATPAREGSLSDDRRLTPRECRETGTTYRGALTADVVVRVDGRERSRRVRLGALPIMVGSVRCHLRGASRDQLVKWKEESTDFGGYFVCNGNERVVRMLVATRRHYPLALRRPAYQRRGPLYTPLAVMLRCVRPCMRSQTVRVHYLADGGAHFAFTLDRAEYFLPAGLLLRALRGSTDREVFEALVSAAAPGEDGGPDAFVAERAELLLRQSVGLGCKTRSTALSYLGRHFRGQAQLARRLAPGATDREAGEILLREHVLIHLDDDDDKHACLLLMLGKLYALASGACSDDSADAACHQEVLLPGHLLAKALSERLEDVMTSLGETLKREGDARPEQADLESDAFLRRCLDRLPDVGRRFEYLLNTGNLTSRSGLDLQQTTGFSIVAERLNFMRYLAHFRSIHRGAYFSELRTTTVRKLLPESWGFLCPVHTPDGAPCGLLLHLTRACRVDAAGPADPSAAAAATLGVLAAGGMVPAEPGLALPAPPDYLVVVLDGRVVGSAAADVAESLVSSLRVAKAGALAAAEGRPVPAGVGGAPLSAVELAVPADLEVALIRPGGRGAPFPGLFLFSQSARMMRPVAQELRIRTLPSREGKEGQKEGETVTDINPAPLELIGTLEQQSLDIAVDDGGTCGSDGLEPTHRETSPGAMLSAVASLTPFSDYNQSPRNMYQCQMGKQTMGTPCHAMAHRAENKQYRLTTPQTPLCRTRAYESLGLDEYPSGTNAVVAVLAHTGYDMEDAMILNKSSVERGAFHAAVYKTETVDLADERGARPTFGVDRPPRASRPAGNTDVDEATACPVDEAPYARSVPGNAFGQELPRNMASRPGSSAVTEKGVVPGARHPEADTLDLDGLPHVGTVVWPGRGWLGLKDLATGRCAQKRLKGEEPAIVDQVTLVGPMSASKARSAAAASAPLRASIRLRFPRQPAAGDKFASRAGQKGVLSQLWPDADMPFNPATGMRPDLVINPNAFPSRMTIGMLIESMAGKAGALDGRFVDASPFQPCAPGATKAMRDPAATAGAALEACGYNRYGGETLISGLTGEEFRVDIYVGIVYYQRLRHMVGDKFQVRATGPINPVTRQPIKGRKAGGGIRLGEMERDALLAHGASYTLHDRLHTCSDYATVDVCARCGSVLSSWPGAGAGAGGGGGMGSGGAGAAPGCAVCGAGGGNVRRCAMPYVFKYLAAELAGMNIKLSLDVVGPPE